MENPKSIFSIFYSDATLNEKKMIICICFLNAFFSTAIIGIPVWFKQPEYTCLTTSETTICHQDDICLNDPSNLTATTKSLVYDLVLICERQYKKRWLLTLVFFGGLLGCLFNISVYIRSERRKTVLSIIAYMFSFAHIMIFLFTTNEVIVGTCLMIIAAGVMIGNSYGFTIINEYLSGEVAKASTIFLSLTRGMFGIFFALFCYFIDASARILFISIGIAVFLLASYLYRYENEKGIKDKMIKSPTNLLEFFKTIMPLTQIRNNFIIFILTWTTYSVTINDILIELESIGGNLYFNISLIASLEVLASYTAGIIIMKFDGAKSLKIFSALLTIVFFSFILSPSLKNSTPLENNIFLVLLLLGKLFAEIICNLVYVFASKYLTEDFTAFFLINVRLFSRVFLLFLPHINYAFRLCDLHAFIFLSIIWALSRFLLIFIKEEETEGLPEILNEYRVSLTGRMSIISGSAAMDYCVDDLLKNIEIGGQKLSIIFQSKHQSLMKNSHKHVEMRRIESLGANLINDNNDG